ncbi:MAG: FAD-binding oxidoreductase [Actinobacteria bacterium]|nr:FAD-binding oxidoreductase [Actinomycetota bacterium]
MAPDFVVVGGGIVGCAVARELALGGASVTLVERGELAAGASGRNHGLLLTPTEAPLVPMFRESLRVYEPVVAASPVPVALDPAPIGFLVVATEPGHAEPALAQAEAARAAGVAVEHLDGEALRAEEPGLGPRALDGFLLDDARRVAPAPLVVALALEARAAGAEILRNLAVRAPVTSGDRVTGVATDDGIVSAGAVVLAAGPWTAGLLRPVGHHVPVLGARGWLVHLAPPDPPVRHVVEVAGWQLLPGHDTIEPVSGEAFAGGEGEPELGTLLHANPDGTVLVGSSRQAGLFPEPEDPEVPRRIMAGAAGLMPSLGRPAVLATWWGVRPMSLDGLPLVGCLGEGLWVATGHGSLGVILGGGTARLLAAGLLGTEPPFDPAPFDPLRPPAPAG